nr:hypothetical protein [Armatimonadota bacterium]
MKLPLLFPILLSITLAGSNARAQNMKDLLIQNIGPNNAPALAAAARAAGMTLSPYQSMPLAGFGEHILVWEAQEGKDSEITPALAQRLGIFVRFGGSLLLSLGPHPGKGPFRLAFMLPTTAWQTVSDPAAGPTTLGETDPGFFPAQDGSFPVPFHWILRPFDAVERGEQRYDQFPVDHGMLYVDLPFTGAKLPPNHNFWTRPLINRDWQVRARSTDAMQTPLLLTGRYGAGRVAVFASSLSSIPDTPTARPFVASLLKWLSATPTEDPNIHPPPLSHTVTTIDRVHRTMQVTINNTSNAFPVEVVARVLTWDGSLIGDVDKHIAALAPGDTTVPIGLPSPGPTGYQSLTYRDAFVVRVGVLDENAGVLLSEKRDIVDLRPPLQLSVATDEINSIPYPFNAPLPGKENRLGLPVMSYAYRPGSTLHAHVTLTNGLRNLAPLAQVTEDTAPGNSSVMALNDEAAYSEKGPIDGIQAWSEWKGAAGKDHDLSFTFPQPVTVAAVTLIGAPNNYRNYLRSNPSTVIIEADGKEVARAEDASQRFITENGAV